MKKPPHPRRRAGRLPWLVALLSGALLGPSPAGAASIVLLGDSTPAFSLWPLLENEGTRRFFENVLGDGSRVVVSRSSPFNQSDLRLRDFYGSLPGVSSERVTDPLTSATLADVDLLVVPPPFESLAPSEAAAIRRMLAAGGSLLILGEGTGSHELQNTNINALLSALGSDLSLTHATLDAGDQLAADAQILTHALTLGVGDLHYGAASIVNGGVPLFRTLDGSPFAATSTAFVPEPASGLLCALGLIAFASSRRRRGEGA